MSDFQSNQPRSRRLRSQHGLLRPAFASRLLFRGFSPGYPPEASGRGAEAPLYLVVRSTWNRSVTGRLGDAIQEPVPAVGNRFALLRFVRGTESLCAQGIGTAVAKSGDLPDRGEI